MQDEIDEVDIRERLGSLGRGKMGLMVVMVVVLEEASLRSDTRLPLESSPYMAGKFRRVDWQLGPVKFPSPPSPAIYFPILHNLSNNWDYLRSGPLESYQLPEVAGIYLAGGTAGSTKEVTG